MTNETTEQKLLIVTYYWPPNGGSGVQRWLKFVKYLPLAGWKPYVFTPENSSFTISDKSLEADVPPEATIVKLPIWEPHELFFKVSRFLGRKKIQQSDFLGEGKKGVFAKMSSWIRGNLFLPDARVFWVRPSVKFLDAYLKKHSVKIIVTTGPPHSLHLIGMKLKKKNPDLQWIADFRDPWSEWDMLESLSTSSFALKIHQRLERKVLRKADRVITISPYYVKRLEMVRQRPVDLITNGFDQADFDNIPRIKTTGFTIRHVGNIDDLRDPRPVMEQIKMIIRSHADFASMTRIEFVGNVNSAFRKFVNEDHELSSLTKFIDHLPHKDLVNLYGSTDLQLLVLAHKALAPGNIPGKVFEYLASGNPVLALGSSSGDVAEILTETNAGRVFERDDANGIREFILTCFTGWKHGTPGTARNVAAWSRQSMTNKLVSVLDALNNKK